MAPLPSTAISRNGNTSSACPRCKQPLVDPQGLAWCKSCGYCGSLERDKPAPVASPAAVPEAKASVPRVPLWCWMMLAEAALLAAATFAFSRQFAAIAPVYRAIWTTAQVALGLGILFVAQFAALILIAPEETSLGFKDVLLPMRLYMLMFKRLPRTRTPIVLACLAITLIASALTFVGGLGYWYTKYMPGQQGNPYKAQF